MKRGNLTLTVKYGEVTRIGEVLVQIVRDKNGHLRLRISAPESMKINRDALNSRAEHREKKNAENIKTDNDRTSVSSQRVDSSAVEPTEQPSDTKTGPGKG